MFGRKGIRNFSKKAIKKTNRNNSKLGKELPLHAGFNSIFTLK
jgi:hypothetical protein